MQSLIKISVIIPTHNRPELVKRAIESYLKAIDLNPQDANAYNNLGNTYSDQKEYSKAIASPMRTLGFIPPPNLRPSHI